MKNSPHIYIAEIPLVACLDVDALCLKRIIKSQVVMMWDSMIVGKKVDLDGSRICPKCIRAFNSLPEPEERTYVFGILAGDEDAIA